MYIVKKTDESRISKATELAGKRSKQLVDTIEDILALRGKDKLDVEIIEEAIDIVDGKKKPTDLVPRKLIGNIFRKLRYEDELSKDWSTWFVPAVIMRMTVWGRIEEEPKETCWLRAGKNMLEIHVPMCEKNIRARKIVPASNFNWDYLFKGMLAHTDVEQKERMLVVRNR